MGDGELVAQSAGIGQEFVESPIGRNGDFEEAFLVDPQRANSLAHMDDKGLSQIALRILQERLRRYRYLDSDLFGEPAWAILLDLFVSTANGSLATVKTACLASESPPTTALRYISILVDRGLVERRPSSEDGRLTTLALTYRAMAAVREYLRHLGDFRVMR